MKKAILFSAIALSTLFVSCKKEQLEPEKEYITNTVTKTDTVKTNTTLHDTIYVVAQSLIGAWNCYKIETITSSGSFFSNQNWKFNFTSTQFQQDLDGVAGFENIYNATYGTNYVDVFYSSSPTTYIVSIVGKEYRLSKTQSSQTQVWYLKK